MKRTIYTLTILLIFNFLFAFSSNAQILNPIKWSVSIQHLQDSEYKIEYAAEVKKPWHLYSYDIAEGGPIPTSFHIKDKKIKTIGNISTNIKATEVFDSMFVMKLKYFTKNVRFSQIIDIPQTPIDINGYVEYMACDDKQCLPPDQYQFTIHINKENTSKSDISQPIHVDSTKNETKNPETLTSQKVASSTVINPINHKDSKGFWLIFIGGFLGGLLAILTPCVFPMIPLTVSFFMKRGRKKKELWNAILYGLSIIVIYVGLGFFITLFFGPDAMNILSTSPWFNTFLFILLVVFAASFFGAFELQLPSSWTNYFDKKADTTSGIVSIFFMAFTLGLVSFSCTGPIIGTLLVEAATSGSTAGPLIGMFGFSLALALPFTLFAIFPSWLHKLPRSGSWLNTVKVVLGFLELALSLKFLSTADLAAHWNILPRETFLSLWIIIFALLGIYLLGLIKFAHDDDDSRISVTRLFSAIISLSFALYMIPGLWGAPLKAVSAFSPPQATQDFDLFTNTISTQKTEIHHKKNSALFHCPLNLNCFFDYEEGMQYAKENHKPVIIDFTGHGCVNCRKMESSVWSDKKVLNMLANDYVLISLYVDDRTELPLSEQKDVKIGNTTKYISTIGNKWSAFQSITFGTNSQPYYVLLDNNGKLLTQPTAFDLDIDNYVRFLESGLSEYKKR